MRPEQVGGFGHEVAVDASCCFPGFGVDDTGDGISLDEFAFSASGIAKCGGGEAVQVAQRSGGGFMELSKDGEGRCRLIDRKSRPRSPDPI
jgi:hypothetical protein